MDYPQVYIFIKPPLANIAHELWTQRANAEAYVQGRSVRDDDLERNIDLFGRAYVHLNPSKLLHPCWVMVCNTTKISDMLLWSIGQQIKAVYWIDSREHAREISNLKHLLDCYMQLAISVASVAEQYSTLQSAFSEQKYITAIDDGRIATLHEVIQPGTQAAAIGKLGEHVRALVRQGLLYRPDLEPEDTSTVKQPSAVTPLRKAA
jgi:hypothetical protein